MGERILVVDDEAVLCRNLARYLTLQGHAVDTAGSGEEALELAETAAYALVITDQRMPGMSGLELIHQLQSAQPEALTLLITAYASVDSAVDALRSGASDYLLKPVALDALGRRVAALLRTRDLEERVRRLRQEVSEKSGGVDLIGTSPAMAAVDKLVDRVAPSPATVLIVGETGTGKELVARALHERSNRANRDFIPVSLAAQPVDLVDATLFGHERGAFTGAAGRRAGVFRAARGGTVFLDEIGELPPAVQAKLLRVIESRKVLPLGADRPVPVEFRLLAATHRDLHALVREGTFREDLLFRLDVVRIEVPPLRDRGADLAPLAARLLERHARSLGRPAPRLTAEALARLRALPWRGNVRELSNALERAALLSDGPWIDVDLLPGATAAETDMPTALKPAMDRFERAHIRRTLAACEHDKRAAAQALDIHLATLYRHLDRLGISDSDG
ncbi:MAG: DNA-binding NtrC family response regulator [Myxococcota bacterium]|jgi:DNA-binding NtrC family response regulator